MANKIYIKQRDLLIPEAERYANCRQGLSIDPMKRAFKLRQMADGYPRLFSYRAGKTKLNPGGRARWTKDFLRKMNELAIAAGLCEEGSV
ncbi:hypothetical protein LCGC14_1484420 [marine sediment metagenome]|uniref:Uncharacterized protein n=1 Tax=marine sediment metagenome TaxID=412755 RepID=A0A0F9J8J5_9ZZZZ